MSTTTRPGFNYLGTPQSAINRFQRSEPVFSMGSPKRRYGGSYRGRKRKSYKRAYKGRKRYSRGKRFVKSYRKASKRYGRKKSMTHGMMLGIKPIGEMTPKFIRKYLKPGSWRFIEIFYKQEEADLQHNLAAMIQRCNVWKGLDMISSLITRLPYIKYKMLQPDTQKKCRQVWINAQLTIINHKMTRANMEERVKYRLSKMAAIMAQQQEIARQVETLAKNITAPVEINAVLDDSFATPSTPAFHGMMADM